MEYPEIKRRLCREAFLCPPMEPFEAPGIDPKKAMSDLLAKCTAMSGMANWHLDSLKNWLMRLFNRNDVAFYGGAISDSSGASRASDIDLMIFPSNDRLPLANTPHYVHAYRAFEEGPGGAVSAQASIFLAGPLLFPDLPDIQTLRLIETERSLVASLPFFKGGIGEVLTYAAFKVVESGQAAEECGKDFPATLKFRLERRWFDSANMQNMVHTPHELNGQIRGQMRELKDPEIYALAMAAMRRLRVKEEARPALASRFLCELRSIR